MLRGVYRNVSVLLLGMLSVSMGCYEAKADLDDGDAECTPGEERACVCSGGGEGEQICLDDGVWGVCSACNSDEDDVASDSSTDTESSGDPDLDTDTGTSTDFDVDLDTDFLLDLGTDVELDCDAIETVEVCLGCECLGEVLDCQDNQACVDLLDCASECGDDTCLSTCVLAHSGGAADALAVFNCSEENCAEFL